MVLEKISPVVLRSNTVHPGPMSTAAKTKELAGPQYNHDVAFGTTLGRGVGAGSLKNATMIDEARPKIRP
jgi:hypothetical protein